MPKYELQWFEQVKKRATTTASNEKEAKENFLNIDYEEEEVIDTLEIYDYSLEVTEILEE